MVLLKIVEGERRLCFYDFSTGRTQTLALLPSGLRSPVISPTGGRVLLTRARESSGDLILVPDFR